MITVRLTALLAGILLIATACADDGLGSSSTSTSSTSTTVGTTTTSGAPAVDSPMSLTANAGDLHVIVPVNADGLPDGATPVVCGGASFQVGDLLNVVPLDEAGMPHIEAAIDPFLKGEEGAYWPQDDWKVLSSSDDRVLLVHVNDAGDDSSLAFMDVERDGSEWRWAGSSLGQGCGLEVALPSNLNTVEWRFDPAYPEPTPDSTTLHLLVTERECASGQAMGDRLVGPEIVVTDSRIHIAYAATALSGGASCPSNPETAVTIEFSAPIGDREVVDGLAFGISLEDLLTG